MHPLILEQIKGIDRCLEDLRTALDDQKLTLGKRQEEHEELQREQWRQRKHQVTISHMTEDLEATHKKLALYESERSGINESLEEVLASLKGLRSSLTD